jgi:hypothetical protein
MNPIDEREKREQIRQYFEGMQKLNSASESNLWPESRRLEEELSSIEAELSAAKKYFEELLAQPAPPFPFKTKLYFFIGEAFSDLKYSGSVAIRFFIESSIKKKILVCVALVLFSSIFYAGFKLALILILIPLTGYTLKKWSFIHKKHERLHKDNLTESQRSCQQQIDQLQRQHEEKMAEIKLFYESQKYLLRSLEERVKEWLEEDKEKCVVGGLNHLQIKGVWWGVNDSNYKVELDGYPIVSFIGIGSDEVDKSLIIKGNRDLDEVANKNQGLYIDIGDFYKVKGFDGKLRYGVYEFVVIFLSDNFISYYKCYYDFVKGNGVDIETCEYLYDSIVSVKTQEKSSLRLKNPEERRKYRDLLSVTTMDGKILYFELQEDRKESIYSSRGTSRRYVSGINQAAERIRSWLRCRRVDYLMTKRADYEE